MLNYIWAGLIVFSLLFAVTTDVQDIRRDTFRNGAALPITLQMTHPVTAAGSAELTIDPHTFIDFYRVESAPSQPFTVQIGPASGAPGTELLFPADAALPAPLTRIRDFNATDDDKCLHAQLTDIQPAKNNTYTAALLFPPVRFATMQAIVQASMTAANTAVKLSLELIGILALWLGLTRIGEAAGLIALFNKIVRPILRPLFPELPQDHPAMGMIALNLTANILGMGNAATPMGLKAMEELQTLNPVKDTATNSMVMLLAMHASSVQLLPPVMVIAVMGMKANELLIPIWIVTFIGFVSAVSSCKLLERLPGYRRSNPNVIAANSAETSTAA